MRTSHRIVRWLLCLGITAALLLEGLTMVGGRGRAIGLCASQTRQEAPPTSMKKQPALEVENPQQGTLGRPPLPHKTLPPPYGKISAPLRNLLQVLRDNGVTSYNASTRQLASYSTPLVKVNEQGDIHTYIHLEKVDATHIAALEVLGVKLEIANALLNIIQGWAPFHRIEAIANLDFVERVESPRYGMTRSRRPVRTR